MTHKEYCRRYYKKHRARIRKQQAGYAKVFYQAHKERYLNAGQRFRAKIRTEALSHYSNGTVECACCGEKEVLFLTLDHIAGGGNKHRKEIGVRSGYNFYLWLRNKGWPDVGLQVLCQNCNVGRFRNGGTCPCHRYL